MPLTDAEKYIEEVTPNWPGCLNFQQRTITALGIALDRIASLESTLEDVKGFFAGAVEYAEKMLDLSEQLQSEVDYLRSTDHAADVAFESENMPPHRAYHITITDTTTPAEAGRALAEFVAGNIPVVDEITPRLDAELGHVFDWPFKE